MLKDRTAFIIAQRLSTVRDADRIVVLDNGTIVEEGTHEELLELGGIYTAIYNLQFRPQRSIFLVTTKIESVVFNQGVWQLPGHHGGLDTDDMDPKQVDFSHIPKSCRIYSPV